MEKIKLTASEQERYDIIRSCIDRDIANKEASIRLGLKVRQIQRIKRAVEKQGTEGAMHKSKGRTSSNATNKTTVKKTVDFLKQKKHQDFGPTFAQEKLLALGVEMNKETLRLLMIKKDLWKPHPRRGPQIVREWRERKERFGELVQFDGSYHDWFENDSEECLLAAIDDATSKIVKAVFEDNEGVFAVFRFWLSYVEAYGLPVAIYLDKFSTYKMNQKTAIENHDTKTQFERAMNELNIEPITAHSSQAKGRVERLFKTLQDRLIKELRLANISTIAEANEFLEKIFLPTFNVKFSVESRTKTNLHQKLNQTEIKKLESIFSRQYQRTVRSDWTVSFNNQWYQLTEHQPATVCKNDVIIVEQRLDGSIHFRLRGKYLNCELLPERPKKLNKNIAWVLTAGPKSTVKPNYKPAPDHPWRRQFIYAKKLT